MGIFKQIFKALFSPSPKPSKKRAAPPRPPLASTSPVQKQSGEGLNNALLDKMLPWRAKEREVKEYIAEKMADFLPTAKEASGKICAINKALDGDMSEWSGAIYAGEVDGRPTCEYAETHKNDLRMMLRCCLAELKSMAFSGSPAAPFYFERVAILARKQKNYTLEVRVCELLIWAYELYMKAHRHNRVNPPLVITGSPRYQAIVKRLPAAKKNLERQREAITSA